ncbi:unnamed protein product [Hermetia illucens]|uniref:Alcohol dehydrogenase n=1 Tax=Hermetia illucens TaxID=343691 RepID=A0A7R8YV78_HERIL|nr:unnamed protein product [Hermetia illucens]
MSLNDKSVVVTGGASGIGLEVCKRLLESDAKGVAIIDILENVDGIGQLRSTYPEKNILFIKADVADKTAIDEAYEEITKSFEYLDIVVNVAGIFNDLDVSRTIGVNIGGIINSTFAAMNYMSKEKGGRGGIIANMSSVVGLDPLFLMPVYTSTKQAIVGFTRSLANEIYFEKAGIKFIILCPGATITQLFTNFTEKIIFPDMGDVAYRVLDRLHKQSPADVSKCILSAIEQCENGSIWIIENKQLHPIKMTRYWTSIEEKV